MAVPRNIVSVQRNSVVNHLCVARIELLQAALDDMVAVAVQDQAQRLWLQLVYEQGCLLCGLDLHIHTQPLRFS